MLYNDFVLAIKFKSNVVLNTFLFKQMLLTSTKLD